MQRQKTIAKWLIIILLCTLAVGAYIIYDTLYISGSGDASAGNDVTDNPDDNDPTFPEEPDPPYFTELPRATQNFAGMKVAHAGGEGSDTLLDAVFTSDGTYLFFRSESEEYDCRGAGLYIAAFDDKQLLCVTRFGEADESFGGAKLTSDGIAAITSDKENGIITVFDTTGNITGKASLPAFVDSYMYVSGTSLYVFFSDGNSLRCAVVSKGLSATTVPFLLSGDFRVREGMTTSDGFILVAEKGDDLCIIHFSQNKGFNVKLTYEKTSFMQIAAVAGDEGAAFALLGKCAAGLRLAVFDTEGIAEAETVVEGASSAVLFSDGVSLTLIRTGITDTYCRHLDLISSSPTSYTIGEVVAVRSYGDTKTFVSCDANNLSVYVSKSGSEFSSLMECNASDGKTSAAFKEGDLLLAFSTTSTEGIFFENFGDADAYLVRLPV